MPTIISATPSPSGVPDATGVVMDMGAGFPGFHTLMPRSSGTVAEVRTQHGYKTAWFGKNHNVRDWHNSQAGPYDLWPTGQSFTLAMRIISSPHQRASP